MNPLELPELLLHIFYFGSESDLEIEDDSLGSPPSIPLGYSHPRSLKPFFRSIVRVKKTWKEIVQRVPSFWVTKISFKWNNWEELEMGLVSTGLSLLPPREQYAVAEELLNGSNGSDIDISITLSCIDEFDEIPESSIVLGEFDLWMGTHIFSASDRVRQLSLFSYDGDFFEMISKRFFLRSWPRLRTMNLETSRRVAEISRAFDAPQLSFAFLGNVNWIENRFGPVNRGLSTLHISHDLELEEIPDDNLQSCTVMAYLSPSLLSSLTELKLEDKQQENVSIRDLPSSLSFARLKRMSLGLITAVDTWHFLKRIDAPLLTVLYISTRSLTENGFPNEVFPQRFPLLEDMGLFVITSSWASVFLRLLPSRHNRLSTLTLYLFSMADDIPRPFETAGLREKFFPQPIEMPNLRNLFLFDPGAIDAWFFTNFNLGNAAGHLFLDDNHRMPRIKPNSLLFPNVTEMTVHHQKDLTYAVTPALCHLIIDLSNDHEANKSMPTRLLGERTSFVTETRNCKLFPVVLAFHWAVWKH